MSIVVLVVACTLASLAQESKSEVRVIARVPEGCEVKAGTLTFAPEGKRVAYVATKGEAEHAVNGETLGDDYAEIDRPVIDASGTHVAFRALAINRRGDSEYVLLYDGKKLAHDDWIGPVSLSPVDGTPAYWLSGTTVTDASGRQDPGPSTLFVGKKQSSKWQSADLVLAPVFTPDGRIVYSNGTKDENWGVLIFEPKGKESVFTQGYHIVETRPTLRGDEIVYTTEDYERIAKRNDDPMSFVVCRCSPKGKDSPLTFGKEYDSAGGPVVSSNGEHLAYRVLRKGKLGVAVDGAKVECTYGFVDELTFAPNGAALAYVAVQDCELDIGKGWQVLDDMAEASGGGWFVVMGDERSELFDETHLPRWSPDGSRCAYAARKGDAWFVCVGEQRSEDFDEIAELAWSADGRKLWLGGRRGRELVWTSFDVE